MLCRFYMADRRKEDRMKRACVLIFLCLPLLLCGCAQKSAEREFFAMDTVMQLRAFDRKLIKAGETRRFSFNIGPEQLFIVNRDMKEVVEPGDFTVMVGSSSDNILLKDKITVR